MKKFDSNKFSWTELFNNSNGKTSASGTAGLFLILIGGISYFMGYIKNMFMELNDILLITPIIIITIGSGLLGYRKSLSFKNFVFKDKKDNKSDVQMLKS